MNASPERFTGPIPTPAQIAADKARRTAERDIEGSRMRCRTLAGFVREAWHVLEPSTFYVHGWHIDVLCAHLEAVTRGEINRLLVNVPPGSSKSLIVSVIWPAYEWGPMGMAHLRYLATSYKDDYTARDCRRMRDLVESEWYQNRWPTRLPRRGETSFSNDSLGGRDGIPFASLTGGRGDRLIIDDPHSTEQTESEADLARTIRIFRESVPGRINDPTRSAIVIIMQRLHEKDVSAEAIKLGYYAHLMIPMEFEPERRCITPLGDVDPRTKDGELMCPERWPQDVIDRDRATYTSYAWAAQMQQRPAPREGGLFKRSWFDIVPVAPAGTVWVRGWDLAASTGERAAYTAGVKLGRHQGRYYIGNIVRRRCSPAQVVTLLKNTASQDGYDCRISIPQDPGQAGKAQAASLVSGLSGYRARATPESGSKVTRAEPVAAQAEAGNVSLVAGEWNEAFLEEAGLFPNGEYLDQIDALSRAFAELIVHGEAPMGITGVNLKKESLFIGR